MFGDLRIGGTKGSTAGAFVHIGQINIEVPLRPMVVHDVVYRESKVIEQKILPEIKNFVIFENDAANSSMEQGTAETGHEAEASKAVFETTELPFQTSSSMIFGTNSRPLRQSKTQATSISQLSKKKQDKFMLNEQNKGGKLSKFVFELKSKMDGCEIRAKLLESPCLKAAYSINNVVCFAFIRNNSSRIECNLDSHCLSFQCDEEVLAPSTEPKKHSSNPTISPRHVPSSNFITTMTMDSLDERTTFYLPSIDLKGAFTVESERGSEGGVSEAKLKETKLIELRVKLAQLNRELNAEVIAQLVFVTKVFIKEINNILQAVYSFNQAQEPKENKPMPDLGSPVNSTAQSTSMSPQLLYDLQIDIGQISLTGITPAGTALSLSTGDDTFLAFGNHATLKPFIEARCKIGVELKAKQKSGSDEDAKSKRDTSRRRGEEPEKKKIEPEWLRLAHFNTRFELRNSVNTLRAGLDRESITITVDRPRFYLQPGAVDSAILFWLNYKSTYEYWLQQRQQFQAFLIEQHNLNGRTTSDSSPNQPQHVNNVSSTTSSSEANFLAIKLRVVGLGLALPLATATSKDVFKTSMDCLVISLNETSIYACSSGCVVSKGQFSNFCLRFAEGFNLSSVEWSPVLPESAKPAPHMAALHQKHTLMNSWVVPSGSYEICSSTVEKPSVGLIDQTDSQSSSLLFFFLNLV